MMPSGNDPIGSAQSLDPRTPRLSDNPALYARAKALFGELSELGPDERAARLQALESAGEEDSRVATLVRTLLKHAEGPHTRRFGAPIAGLLAGLANAEVLAPGTRLGAWTLTRKIGEGGMGSVYAAQRSDGHFEQTAAIKVLRGLPSPAALEFLARERQILATLAHPNIARLLDGGATPQGQPYLVMEFLDGIPIDQHCRNLALPSSGVLSLLIEVCAAVSFAHSRLVVHCDLKPSNILVDANGRPQLLDFGIARLLDSERAEGAEATDPDPRHPTRGARMRAFTPGCASPEQERGDAVSTLSDVYSLGRLLEQLLGAARLDASPELRAVVLMATQHDPMARYASAAALSRDLRHFLRREPVLALAGHWAYRTRKLLQRRWPVALAALGFGLTVAAFTWQLAADRDRARDAERQALAARDQATRAETSARQISAFLGNILSSVDPDNARTMDRTLMRTLLDQAAAKAQNELREQPVIRRQIETVVGDSYRAISEFNAAVQHYEFALQTISGSNNTEQTARLQLQYKRIAALLDANRSSEAAELLDSAIADVEAAGNMQELALKLRTQQAYRLFKIGDLKAALASAQETQRRFESSHSASPDAWLSQLNILSLLLSNSGQFEQAEPLMQRAINIASESFGELHSRTLRARHSLAVLLMQSRRRPEAVAQLKPLLADMERALGPAALLTISAVSNLGTALRGNGQLADSALYYRMAYERSLAKFGATDPLTLDLANNLALYEIAAGQPQVALDRMQPVIAQSEQLHARTHPSLVEALRTRATALAALGQVGAARTAWQDVIQRDIEAAGPDDAQTRDDQAALAKLEARRARANR